MPAFDDDFWKDIAPGEGRLSGPLGDFGVHTEAEPRCSNACPAGVDVKAYVNLIADRRFERAVDTIRRSNPFPGVCGRVCTHPCEAECGRAEIDGPLAIRALKRFASDYDMARKVPASPVPPSHEERIAVVGAGPAGLTAAANLAYEGFSVDVYDSALAAGGMMAWGIPEFRLPKDVLRSEVKDIEDLGVRILLGERIKDPGVLLEKGYSVVILATGCMKPMPLGLEGENSHQVIDCLDFLRKANTDGRENLEGNVLVIGGGSAALDSARTARRLGAEATIVYRRSREQMPAHPEEIRDAEDEGVILEYLAMPSKLIFKDSVLKGLKCQRTELGEPDESGRRTPIPVDEFFELEADLIIPAIGSKPDPSTLGDFETTEWGAVKVDKNAMTSIPGIFAAGDAVTGPSSIVEAIGTGHDAAKGVIEYLTGEAVGTVAQPPMLAVEGEIPEQRDRTETTRLPPEGRSSGFDEVDLGFGEASALAEASRCRRCGTCSVCDVCLGVCDHTQAVASDEYGNCVLIKVPRSLQRGLMKDAESGKGWSLSVGGQAIKVTITPLLAVVDADKCIACGICDEVCVYRAVRVHFYRDGLPAAVVDQSACRACGACSAACPTGAISQGHMGWPELRKRVYDTGEAMAFSCIWRNAEGLSAPGISLMCTRAASPALILEALARGADRVAAIGCEGDCHYLPGPWMGQDVVESTKLILEAAGHDPGRIAYIESADETSEVLAALGEQAKIHRPTPSELPDIQSPLGLALQIAYEMAIGERKKMHIADAVMSSYGLEGPGQMFESKASLDAVGEPGFRPTRRTVAVHSSTDAAPIFELLGRIPELTAIEVAGKCGETGWKSPDAHARQEAINLLRQARSKGADALIVDSAECLTHIRAVQRGWSEVDIEVVDVYSFMLSRLREGDA